MTQIALLHPSKLNNSCDTQIIFDYLLCEILLVMKKLRPRGKGMF